MIRRTFATILVLCAVAMTARDLSVTVKVEGRPGRYMGVVPVLVTANPFSLVSYGEENTADSVFMFYNIPDADLAVGYIHDGGLYCSSSEVDSTAFVLILPAHVVPREVRLSEVSVEASRQHIDDEKTVYIPTSQQKKTSHGGADLIGKMNLAAVRVNPATDAITMADGSGVSTYIDYLPASATDVANLRPVDVLRVEVFDYPKDPRFNNAHHVVNFVLVRYEYGGYTRLNGSQGAILDFGNYSAASKLSVKKMTYDLNAGYYYSWSAQNKSFSETEYVFPDKEITQANAVEKSIDKSHVAYANMRAVYRGKDESVVISNTVGGSYTKFPGNYNLIREAFMPQEYPDGISENRIRRKSGGATWTGDYQFALSNSFSLFVRPSLRFARNSRLYEYMSATDGIYNDVDEDQWNAALQIAMNKRFGRHSLELSASTSHAFDDIDYRGTSPRSVDIREHDYNVRLQGTLMFGKFYIMPSAMVFYVNESMDGFKNEFARMKYFIAARYAVNQRNSITLSSELSYWTVPATQLAPNIQYLSQILAVTGNPGLTPYMYNAVNISYNFIPSNRWSLSVYSNYSRHNRPIVEVYEPMADAVSPVMLRSFEKDGYFHVFKYGASASVNLLDNSLRLNSSLWGESANRHGFGAYTSNYVCFNVQANYSIRNFFIGASYQAKYNDYYSLGRSENREYFLLGAGWGNGDLSISCRAYNPFYSGWKSGTSYSRTLNYSSIQRNFTASSHRYFMFQVSYSFSYGKKVQRDKGISAPDILDSGILK